jgi:hypothetical protein
MQYELIWTALLILAAILLFSPQALGLYRRFDSRNQERLAQERSDRADGKAHFRHTLALAEEQVEDVTSIVLSDARTGTPVTRWLFEGEQYASEDEARAARDQRLREIAVGFYRELPAALAARKGERIH